MERILTYAEAIREATEQEMDRDPSVIVLGLGVDDPKPIYGTTQGLAAKFGPDRVFNTPLSEEGMTGVAIGAALAGLRPVHVHIRMDFLLLAMNQLINMAAKSRYMYGGSVSVPIVVRSIIGKSWGQGAQHSQGLYSFFMHVPGLKVVTPYTDEAKAVMAKMKEMPINDFMTRNGRIREDGRVIRDMYLMQAKTPDESKSEWDLAKIIATIPGEQAFRPLAEGGCPLVKK